MTEALLALGGNVGNSRAILDRAVALLCDGIDIKLTARSSDYQTPPWGFKYQSPFINLCIAVETELSPRELEVLELAAKGLLRNKTIAERLGISVRTVEGHFNYIFAKFGVSSRMEAVLYAMSRRLVRADKVASP